MYIIHPQGTRADERVVIGSDVCGEVWTKSGKVPQTCFSNAAVDSARREIKFRIDSGEKNRRRGAHKVARYLKPTIPDVYIPSLAK